MQEDKEYIWQLVYLTSVTLSLNHTHQAKAAASAASFLIVDGICVFLFFFVVRRRERKSVDFSWQKCIKSILFVRSSFSAFLDCFTSSIDIDQKNGLKIGGIM